DEWTLQLITNDEVLAVNQKAAKSKELFTRGDQVAWVAEMPGTSAKYLAVFNTGDRQDEEIRIDWSQLGLAGNCAIRDLWAKHDLAPAAGGQTFKVAPHASMFYRIEQVRR